MTAVQQLITIGIMAAAVMATRFVSFIVFPSAEKTPKFVHYLSKYLPSAVFGMLVIYCVKDIDFLDSPHGLPQAIGILACVLLHLWKRKMLLSIAGSTVVYMFIVQVFF